MRFDASRLQLNHARHDALAALTVSALLLPQSLAYALLAGLPPVVGVMASLAPLLAYAAFGSSTTLAVGPAAVLALMTAQAVERLGTAYGVPPTLVAMVLALQSGALLALAAALRLDALAALLSAPVLQGFGSGAALAIALGQVPALLGVKLSGGALIDWVPALASGSVAAPHALSAAIGLGAVLLLVLAKRGARWAPRSAKLAPLALVGLGIAVVFALQAAQVPAVAGVKLAGSVSLAAGLQFPPLTQAPAALWWDTLPTALMIALVAYVSSLSAAQALAARRGEHISPRRELLGLAAANAAAGVSGGMPVAGSFSRSSITADAGARTRWAGAFTAVAFGAWMLVGADLLARLPHAVLAATIVVAVLPMVDIGAMRRAWAYARPEGALMVITALLVLAVGVEWALGLGVAGSIGLLLQRTARPHWAEVGELPDAPGVFRNVRRFDVQRLPQVMAIRIDEGLRFTNARWLSDVLWAELAARPDTEQLVLMMSGVNEIDLSGLEALQQFATEWQARGPRHRLHLSELKGPVADRLQRAGLAAWLPGRVFRTQAEAWEALRAAA